jgi:HTH-type transcriptional regulator/antitoxin HigA
MDIRPIKTETDYEGALAEIAQLWGAAENTPEGDKLDILLTLVEAYEQAHYPIDPPDPVEAIKFRMDQMGLSRKDLEPSIGKRGRVAEVLNGQRSLSLNMIRRLHTHLHIPLESLLGLAEHSLQTQAVASGK